MDIDFTLANCRNEAEIMWKVNGNKPTGYLPFSYIPLSESAGKSSDRNRANQQNEDNTQKDSANQADLLYFYRNLLGLKLHFSHAELKKCYHEAVGRYHPDHYSTSSVRDRENAEILMKQVNEAYEKLKEMVKKG